MAKASESYCTASMHIVLLVCSDVGIIGIVRVIYRDVGLDRPQIGPPAIISSLMFNKYCRPSTFNGIGLGDRI